MDTQLPTVVYVTTASCQICGPTERELLRLLPLWQGRIHYVRVDADEQPEAVAALDIRAVPALLVFVPGMPTLALLGFHTMEQLHQRFLSIIPTVGEG